jgi:hypothetical protein
VRAGRYVIGIVLVLVGALYLVSAIADVDATGVVADWWPAVLVAIGVVQYGIDHSARLGSAVLVIVGLVLVLFTTGLVEGSVWTYLWPIAAILAGIAVMIPRLSQTPQAKGDTADAFVALGSRVVQSRSQRFRGGEVTALLGSIVLDLTETSLAPDARLTVTAILGGCEVLVPPGWDVRIGGVPLLGGWDDTTRRSDTVAGAPVLNVRVVAILAGVEIRHPVRWS